MGSVPKEQKPHRKDWKVCKDGLKGIPQEVSRTNCANAVKKANISGLNVGVRNR